MKLQHWSRRNFIKTTGIAGGLVATGSSFPFNSLGMSKDNSITISEINSNFEREPLIRPFGFKGGYMSEIWQTAAWMKSTSGIVAVGLTLGANSMTAKSYSRILGANEK